MVVDGTTSRSTWRRGGWRRPRSDEVHLTPIEWGLVVVLVRNGGKLVAQRQLLQEVWGPKYGEEAQLPAGPHRTGPGQARAGAVRPRYFIDRARYGLPVRPVTLSSPARRGPRHEG